MSETFPIMREWVRLPNHAMGYRPEDLTFIPWALIAPHEETAQWNHCGQTLRRLASRGGLSACEAVAIIEDRQWRSMEHDEVKAAQRLRELVDEFNKTT